VNFYLWTSPDPAVLLRDNAGRHHKFQLGKWHPTDKIRDHIFGPDDFVDPITEEEARARFPEAFLVV
jgi:hypothetical protein